MGEKQGLDVVVEAARRTVGNADVLFVLCGDGSARERLVLQAKGLANIRWLPLQPAERLNELLNLADIHLLPQRAGMGELMMPSKLLGMLASGRPVLAMAEQGTQLANEVAKCGVVLVPGDMEGLAAAIERLSLAPGERKIMGEAARIAAVKWTRKTVLGEFDVELRKL
jgi:colanic acid biosynthesis glycosyl transferase WcaI